MKVYVFDLLAYSREIFMERRSPDMATYGRNRNGRFEVRNGIKQTFAMGMPTAMDLVEPPLFL